MKYPDDFIDKVICGDCLEVMKEIPDNSVDLVLTDPPYGINWIPRVNNREFMTDDNHQFNPNPFLKIGKEHIFWGANYYADLLPPSPDWLVWIKRPIHCGFSIDKRTYSTIDLAWSDIDCGGRFKVHVWDGGLREGNAGNRIFCHPAQKPIELMSWCLSLSKTNGIVLDPFLGSGTTAIACKQLNRHFIGIEINPDYCKIARERLMGVPDSLFKDIT